VASCSIAFRSIATPPSRASFRESILGDDESATSLCEV
jgi:hypothetical protein